MAKQDYYIGLMSGTSRDGIDAVIVDLSNRPQLIQYSVTPYPPELNQSLARLCRGASDELALYAELDVRLGQLFAGAALELIQQAGMHQSQIKAIGSHGQTVRHLPQLSTSLQIADPNIIAERTGIATVADFRRRDLAAGGQGAPLVPAFHHAVFRHEERSRVIVNIGGIANITLLPGECSLPVMGFDSGPGNTLMDNWIYRQQQHAYDVDGQWAAQGQVNESLLASCLADDYFQQASPKSTGPEYFNSDWLDLKLQSIHVAGQVAGTIPAVDIQATLCALTACTIVDAIKALQMAAQPPVSEVYVAGGGVHNSRLMAMLQQQLGDIPLNSTAALGIDPDWVEAIAFAWLAKQTLAGRPANLPAVTGASHGVVLGGIYR